MPADLTKSSPEPDPDDVTYAEVGAFRQGTPFSQWALARYLVGRSIGASLSRTLLALAVLLLAVAALLYWVAHTTFGALVVAVIGLMVLALRAVLRWVLNKITAAGHYGPLEARLCDLVSETRGDILAELRRVGLPGRSWTLPLLAVRLVRPTTRRATLERLTRFDVDRAVTPARVDELHHVLRAAVDRPGRAA